MNSLRSLSVRIPKVILVCLFFYQISPSQVREQKENFEEALTNHKGKLWCGQGEKTVGSSMWSSYFVWVAHRRWVKSQFFKRIFEEIFSTLNPTTFSVAKHPVALNSPVWDIKSLLEIGLDDVWSIGIYGSVGIGKTTVPKSVYNHIINQYEGSVFIENVREVSSQKIWKSSTIRSTSFRGFEPQRFESGKQI